MQICGLEGSCLVKVLCRASESAAMEADAPPLLETETKGFFLGSRGGGCGGGSGGGCKAEEKENLVATRAGGRDCFHGN